MFKYKRIIIYFLCFLTSIFTPLLTCKTNNKLDLDESVELAYEHRPDLEGFDYLIRSNWYEERAAIGGYLPQISILAESGRSSEPGPTGSGISPIPREGIALEISQLIFSYNGPLLQYKVAQEETNISKAQKEKLENSIRINTEYSFLKTKKILLKKQFITALNESSNEEFDQERSRHKAGFLNRAQWENAKFQYSQGQTKVKNYPNDIDANLSNLRREINTKIKKEEISLEYKNLNNIKLEQLENYKKRAIIHRPDLTEFKYKIKQAQYSERLYRYQYIPEIYFGANMQKSRIYACPPEEIFEALPQFDNEPLFWHIGLQVTWKFDGLSSFNRSKKFDNLSTNFLLQKRDLELNILKNIEVTYNDLANLLNLLEPTQKKYQAQKTQQENIKKQYNVGLAPICKYKTAQFNFKRAEFNLISLKIDIKNNYQKLLFLCGYPPEIS